MARTTAESLKELLQYHTGTEEAMRELVDMATETERRLQLIEEKIEPLGDIIGKLNDIDKRLTQMQVSDDERRRQQAHEIRNRPSLLLQQVALTLSIILMTTPILISEVRTAWFGENPLTWLLALLAAIALFMGASIVMRRNGDK